MGWAPVCEQAEGLEADERGGSGVATRGAPLTRPAAAHVGSASCGPGTLAAHGGVGENGAARAHVASIGNRSAAGRRCGANVNVKRNERGCSDFIFKTFARGVSSFERKWKMRFEFRSRSPRLYKLKVRPSASAGRCGKLASHVVHTDTPPRFTIVDSI